MQTSSHWNQTEIAKSSEVRTATVDPHLYIPPYSMRRLLWRSCMWSSCARCSDETINWIRFNKRCSFMVMRAWIWVSSAHRYQRGENSPALFSLLSVTSHPYHTLTPYHRSTSSSLFFSYQLATQPPAPLTLTLHAQTPSPHPPHRFESSLDVDALAPRHGGVGETIPGTAAARDVHSLPSQVPEGFSYHQNCIMGQRWSVLRGHMTEKVNDSKRRRVRGGTKSVSKRGSIKVWRGFLT